MHILRLGVGLAGKHAGKGNVTPFRDEDIGRPQRASGAAMRVPHWSAVPCYEKSVLN
jgi:hypothetical protein